MPNHRKSFTLIELLVVLALVAILSVVVVITLNPAELLKQARDSNRLSDLATINTALNLFSTDVTSGFMGTSTVVYVSIPDNASSTCGSLGLPTLPTGWNYNCVTAANLRNTNGTGWIPVNFQRISSNSPISQLPIDPINTTSSGEYYTYAYNNGWHLATSIESTKYSASALADGGTDPAVYEVGTNLNAAPFARSLWQNVGDFEAGTDGFGVFGGGIPTSSSANGSVINSNALLIIASGTVSGASVYSFPTLIVGQKYIISFYAKNIANPGATRLSNQSGSGDESCLSFSFTPTSKWQQFSNICTLNVIKNRIYLYSFAAGQQWVTDGLRIELAN